MRAVKAVRMRRPGKQARVATNSIWFLLD